MSDLFTIEIVCNGSMERKRRIVISPLGAINSKGFKGNLDNLS